MVASRWFIFWEKCIYIQLSAQDHSKCHLFAFMSLVLMDVFELFWRHAIRYCSFSHFIVALSSLGASQVECPRASGREPEHEERRTLLYIWLRTKTVCCTAWILWSRCSLSQRPLSQLQLLQVPALLCYSVLITDNRTEPQYWTCKTFVKFNRL